jgi:regulator of RNase E activity RraA
MPYEVNTSIACGNVLGLPGHIIMPTMTAPSRCPPRWPRALLERASHHVEWEEFSRVRLAAGGELRRYYPLAPDAETEYREWKAQQSK